jgi:hypothetical protein
MSSNAKLVETVARAIRAADSSYFNEDYTKQAEAALQAVSKAGFALVPTTPEPEVFHKAADVMRTGRLKPHEHVQNVYETVLSMLQRT